MKKKYYTKKINNEIAEMIKYVEQAHHDIAARHLLTACIDSLHQIEKNTNDIAAQQLARLMLDSITVFNKKSEYQLMDCIF